MNDFGTNSDESFEEDEAFEVDIQPDATALRMFQSMSFTPWFALGEFVDNSITSAMVRQDDLLSANGPDYRLRVKINFSNNNKTLTVEDNAAGITRKDMQRALRTGQPPGDISVGLSRHGVGMKAASFWWGERLEISTYPLGGDHGWHAVIDVSGTGDIRREVLVEPIPMRPSGSGTVIKISGLQQNTPTGRTKGAIRQYLPSIYRAFLGGGTGSATLQCELEYEGALLKYENPELLTAQYWASADVAPPRSAPEVLWRKDFSVTLESGKTVSGWYGLLKTMSRDGSGFFLHYRGKGIAGVVPVIATNTADKIASEGAKDSIARSSYKPREIFAQAGSRRDQSIIGEFDISDFGKTISTDSPLWNPTEEDEFKTALLADMTSDPEMNFIRMATNFPRRKVSKETSSDLSRQNAAEVQLLESALSNQVEHVDLSHDGGDDRHPEATESATSEISGGDSDLEYGFDLQDSEGHTHHFTCRTISDRSADFISVLRGAGHEHVVEINRLHPALSDVVESSDLLRVLQRISVSMAAAEVFLSFQYKTKVRQCMNDYLGRIGSQVTLDE